MASRLAAELASVRASLSGETSSSGAEQVIDFRQVRYGKAPDGTIAVVLSDVARGLRRMKDDNTIVANADLRETMRWAADFLDAVERLLPEKIS